MVRIGVAMAVKTKFNSTTNNPFQGPTTVTFQSPAFGGSPFMCFTDPFDPSSPMVKNSTVGFAINRLKASDPGWPGAVYGNNRRLYVGIAQAQTLSSQEYYEIVFGVNNNGALGPDDGVVIIRLTATDGAGDPVDCFGREDGPSTSTGEGVFTKVAAGDLSTPVILTDGDNFKFSFNQSLEAAAPGNPPEFYRGTFFIPQSFLDAIPNPGDEIEIAIDITMVYNTPSTGGHNVFLTDTSIILRLINS